MRLKRQRYVTVEDAIELASRERSRAIDTVLDFTRDTGPDRCRIGFPLTTRDLPGGIRVHCAHGGVRCLLPTGHVGWCRFRDETMMCIVTNDPAGAMTYHELIRRREGQS